MEVDVVLHEGADEKVAVVIPILRHGDTGDIKKKAGERGGGQGGNARTAIQLGPVPSAWINRQLGVPLQIFILERMRCPGINVIPYLGLL